MLVQAPIVTMKIAAVRGVPVDTLVKENTGPRADANERKRRKKAPDAPVPVAGWALRREYPSTYPRKLEQTERVVEGKFVGHAEPGVAVVPISIEQGLANDMNLKLGDEIEWDVQGVPLRTKIASVRAVEWRRMPSSRKHREEVAGSSSRVARSSQCRGRMSLSHRRVSRSASR